MIDRLDGAAELAPRRVLVADPDSRLRAEISAACLRIAPHLLNDVASNLATTLLIVYGESGIDANDD